MIRYETIYLEQDEECLLAARNGYCQVFINGEKLGDFGKHTDEKKWLTLFGTDGKVKVRIYLADGIFRSAEDFSSMISLQ